MNSKISIIMMFMIWGVQIIEDSDKRSFGISEDAQYFVNKLYT